MIFTHYIKLPTRFNLAISRRSKVFIGLTDIRYAVKQSFNSRVGAWLSSNSRLVAESEQLHLTIF